MVNSKLSHEVWIEDCGADQQIRRGNLPATVRIMVPEGGDSKLEALRKKWRGEKPFDPRKEM